MSTAQGLTRAHAHTHSRKQVYTQTYQDKNQWLYSMPWLTSVEGHKHTHKVREQTHSHKDESGQFKRTFENKSNVLKPSKHSKTNQTFENELNVPKPKRANWSFECTHSHAHTQARSRTHARKQKYTSRTRKLKPSHYHRTLWKFKDC